jgi:two-component system sensor histidine kinase/response regulator
VADEAGRDAIPSRRRRVREIRSRLPVEVRARARILLVEDNIVNQQVEIRMLERIGYKADWASNGREALEKLANKTYDIILMDCQMPQMDGYTATREIRRHEGAGTHVTIIGVTAHALVGDREECLAAGMDDYISKPVIPEDLAAILEKWVMAGNVAAEVSPSRLKAPEYSDSARQAAILDLDVLAGLRECQKPGEHDFLTHLIGVFLADLSDRLTALRSALTLGDTVGMREAAHALKGGAGELGARRMQSMCEQLEMTARDGFLGGAEAMLRELEREAHNLREALEAEKIRASA